MLFTFQNTDIMIFARVTKLAKMGKIWVFFYLVSIMFRFEKFLLLTVSVFSVY